jgi:O-antigen/teichoic acid export membrane protein
MRQRILRATTYVAGDGLGPFLIRAVAGAGAVRIGAMFASFLVGVQLARGLGPAGYGYYGIALSVVTIAGIPGEMGISPLVTREVAAADARGHPGYLFGVLRWGRRTAAGLSVAMAFAVIAGAVILQQFRPSPLVLALIVAAPVIPFIALAKVDGGALRGLDHIVLGQLPAFLLKPVAMALLLFGMLLLGLKQEPWIAAGLNSVTAGLAWIVAAIWLKQRLPPALHLDTVHEGRRWVSSMVPIALAQGMQVLQVQLSVLLLGLMASAAEVGLFRIATSTAVMLSAPQAIMVTVAGPTISRLYAQDDKRRLQTLLTRCAQAQFFAVLLLSAPLLIAPEPILSLVYGPRFAAAGDVLRIILAGQLVTLGFGLNATFLNMSRYERRVTRALAIALVLNVATLAILVPFWGMLGAAVAYVVSTLAWNIATWLDARRLAAVDTSFLPLRARKAPE